MSKGASRGIGKGCAKALAELGAKVYITGRKSETIKKAADEIGENCHGIVCDHAHPDQIKSGFSCTKVLTVTYEMELEPTL